MDYLQITPLEHVALKEDGLVTVQMQDGRICNLESRRDRLALLLCEQNWIKKNLELHSHME